METEECPKLVEALERYAVKMKLPLGSVNPAEYNDKKDELLATLHTELRQFQDKTGPYSRDYIWKACEIERGESHLWHRQYSLCLLYTSPSPRDQRGSRMPSSA